ncbi:MAG: tryptophan 7-halogenase [Litorimonas sp.]
MPHDTIKKIAVFGNGLAGLLCVAKLVNILPSSIELTYIEASQGNKTDIFFGTVTSPETYEFLLGLGITEPDVLPHSRTSFSLGTRYKNWGSHNREWMQSFYRPLPAYNGVSFHHYLTRLRTSAANLSKIETYIMSAQAAESGVFAHPPEGKKIPLADVEYGYHFLPEEWCSIISRKIENTSVNLIKADVLNVSRQGDSIQSVSLSNEQSLEADFFIDALGPQSKLADPHAEIQSSGRNLKAVSSVTGKEKLEGVCRVLTGTDFGWLSETPIQNGTHHLTVYDPDSETEALAHHRNAKTDPIEVTLGKLTQPWLGNCLTLGHGAAIVEPLTPAPILLLQKDIERLAELIPVTDRMTVESREYNRRFHDDYAHAEMFSRAFFDSNVGETGPYWDAATNSAVHEKLEAKIRQFKSRGVLVQFDYEPFSEQDWTVLHLGMGRDPVRYDPLADHIPKDQLKNKLEQMNKAIKIMAEKMPPHHVYMTGLLKYLKDKHG